MVRYQKPYNLARFLNWPPAIFVLVAAMLKLYQIVETPFDTLLLLGSRKFSIMLVEIEFALSVWLMSGIAAKLSKAIGISCYLGFVLYSLVRIANGESDCGCFGYLIVPPQIALLMNSVMLFSLLNWDSILANSFPRRPVIWYFLSVAITIAFVGSTALAGKLLPAGFF